MQKYANWTLLPGLLSLGLDTNWVNREGSLVKGKGQTILSHETRVQNRFNCYKLL